MQARDSGFFRYAPAFRALRILGDDLGADLANTGADYSPIWGPLLSFEEITDVLGESDVILCLDGGSELLLSQPLFQRLPAAVSDQVFTSSLLALGSYGSAIALVTAIAEICDKMPLYTLHARSAVRRGLEFQADVMLSGWRERIVALASIRQGLNPDHTRSAHPGSNGRAVPRRACTSRCTVRGPFTEGGRDTGPVTIPR